MTLTQIEVSDLATIGQQALSALETGAFHGPIGVRRKVAAVLGISPDELTAAGLTLSAVRGRRLDLAYRRQARWRF